MQIVASFMEQSAPLHLVDGLKQNIQERIVPEDTCREIIKKVIVDAKLEKPNYYIINSFI